MTRRLLALGAVGAALLPAACSDVEPQLVEITPRHYAACIRISPEEPDIEQVAPGATPGLVRR